MFKARLMALSMALSMALALTAAGSVHAQAAAGGGKKELIAKILQLQQPGIEGMARTLTEQPAMQLMQAAGQALQRMPAERRDAVARDIEADLRKYVEDATPIVRDRAIKLAPTTIGALLDERFTEDELRQVIALLESPVNRKFQAMVPDMQRAIGEKVVTETRGEVEGKLRALETSVKNRLGPPAAANGAAAKPAAAASSPKK